MTTPAKDITQKLIDWRNGNSGALDQLMPIVYEELHRLADHYLRRERRDQTLQATALVHEAYLRLVDHKNMAWQNRAHFFAVAATLMRRILVDYARRHHSLKRGGAIERLSLDESVGLPAELDLGLVALDEALTRLATIDPPQSRIIELRFFSGLTLEEVAEVLGLSPGMVHYEWRMAKAWLYRELSKSSTVG